MDSKIGAKPNSKEHAELVSAVITVAAEDVGRKLHKPASKVTVEEGQEEVHHLLEVILGRRRPKKTP
ncbi:hypothetical protein HZB58_04210 [Candidatus Gottesmanbacteria bacterium]|nr:hypothetical protein [Candidatus Gottesmanbacteria bacterium]